MSRWLEDRREEEQEVSGTEANTNKFGCVFVFEHQQNSDVRVRFVFGTFLSPNMFVFGMFASLSNNKQCSCLEHFGEPTS